MKKKVVESHITTNDNTNYITNKGFEEPMKIESETFFDEKGEYFLEHKVREIPRKTFLLGNLIGKYWGELDAIKDEEYVNHKFYDFNVYEISLKNVQDSIKPFESKENSNFPRERIPKLLPVSLIRNSKEYELNLLEPKIWDIKFNRKLHQDEDTEVFGTIESKITGYVLDFIKEEYTEKKYLADNSSTEKIKQSDIQILKTSVPTGNVKYNGNYKSVEKYYDNYKSTYWSEWKYHKSNKSNLKNGCLSTSLGFISVLIGIIFLIIMLPRLAILIPIFLILLVLNIIPTNVWSWVFRLFAGILFLSFIFSIFNSIHSSSNYIPRKFAIENANGIKDANNKTNANDSLITHYRHWQDYDGNIYDGKYSIKKSDFDNAKAYKNSHLINSNNANDYDKMLFSLKEFDREKFNSLYQLFDTLKVNRKLDNVAFVNMVFTFVQDIPYTIVLPDNCDPKLYADNFIKTYLTTNQGKCDGFEKFGINTPVEFMATLNGDCDTRTLLLYTILTHYNYDVALLSSEVYSHSIIGINLPFEGKSYNYNGQNYVLWETTAPNIKAGIIPNEISEITNWRISLKTK